MARPVTIPSGRLRPPVAPAARTTGNTGSTHGDSAVAAPAINANSTSNAMRSTVFYAARAVTDACVGLALTNAQCAIGALEAAQESLDHQRVELCSSSVLELRARCLGSDAHAVAAVGHHRLVRVGDGKDARLRRDLGAGKTGRIATPVGALVRLQDP